MTTESLVQRAIAGDVDAFTDLVTMYQGMAFAYAVTTLNDYQLAEDAVQQSLLTAYRNLTSLRDPRRFGGWLRGIVRFECLRLLRERSRHRSDSLDAPEAFEVVDQMTDVEQEAEIRGEVQRVLSEMARLPEHQLVVAQLYYLADQSQAAVAEFLGLSVSTVNNRLREARAFLRQEGVYPVSTQSMNNPDFSKAIGNVIRSQGQMIDARIERESRPPLLTAVEIGDSERTVAAFISQYLDDDVARLVVMDGHGDQTDVASGLSVHSKGHVTDVVASSGMIDQLVRANRAVLSSTSISTGIKVIDLFAPLVEGGVVAIVGAMNVGKLVIVEELAARLERSGQQVTILVFLSSPDELGVVHKLDLRTDGSVTAMMVPVADASFEALVSSLDRVNTVVAMSGELAREGFYPAIDPLVSRSLTFEASPIATHVRELFRVHPEDERAHLLRAYLTQPFFVAEPYTGRAGVTVTPEEAVADIARILKDDVATLEPAALMMRGSLTDLQ